MKSGNCWVFALKLWFKHGTANSYLIVRKSRFSWVPHVMWAPTIEGLYVEEYKPKKTHWGLWTRIFPVAAIWFRGRIRRGAGEENAGTKFGGGDKPEN